MMLLFYDIFLIAIKELDCREACEERTAGDWILYFQSLSNFDEFIQIIDSSCVPKVNLPETTSAILSNKSNILWRR